MYRLGRLWRTRSQLIIKSKITTITCMGIILGKMIMKMKKNIRWWGVVNHKKKGISLVIIIRIILGTTLEIIINIAIRYLRYVSKKRYHNSHSLMWKRRKWTIIIIIFQVKWVIFSQRWIIITMVWVVVMLWRDRYVLQKISMTEFEEVKIKRRKNSAFGVED